MIEPLDETWLRRHPLPQPPAHATKNDRGRVLLVGGAEFVPGALRLTGEAVLRAGAGKLQLATVKQTATALGVLLPEAAMIALPSDEDGEIALAAAEILTESIDRCDTLILGPGTSYRPHFAELVTRLLARPREALSVVLDAAAVSCASALPEIIASHCGRVLLTPHAGEMALLAGIEQEEVSRSPEVAAASIADAFSAIVVLKGPSTIVAARGGEMLAYEGGGVGLATGGSGDVLAGIAGGLLARGAAPLSAAAWAVAVHGEAGRRAADEIGEIGFLARDLLATIPKVLRELDIGAAHANTP